MSQKRPDNENHPAAKRPPLPPKGRPAKGRNSPRRTVQAAQGSVPQRSHTTPQAPRVQPAPQPPRSQPAVRPSPAQPVSQRSNIQNLASLQENKRRKISSIDHAEHIRATQRKRTITSALILTVVVLLIMVVAAAAVLYVSDYLAAKPNYTFVSNGTIEHTIGAAALIIRDEQTYAAANEGSLVTLALEGSRVSKGQELAMVVPADIGSTTVSLNNIQQQIVDQLRTLMDAGKGSGAETVCSEADSQILPIIKQIRADSVADSLSNLVSYSSSIQVLMDKRDSALQNIDFQDEELSALIAGKEELESTLSAQSSTLSAEIPGIVSFKLDGLEGQLNSTMISDITPEQYAAFVEQSKGSLSSDLTIKKDEAALRICQNAEQYLVTVVAGFSVTDFPADSTVNIRVPSEGIVIEDCKVVRSVQSTGGVFIVLQTTSQVERLLDLRTAQIEIIQKSTNGLRVPASALIDPDYTTGYADILYNSSGYARKLRVVVADHDREYAIIQPVEGYDSPNLSTIIITNPSTISVGDKVEQ